MDKQSGYIIKGDNNSGKSGKVIIHHESLLQKLFIDKLNLKKSVNKFESWESDIYNLAITPIFFDQHFSEHHFRLSPDSFKQPFLNLHTDDIWQKELEAEVEHIALKYTLHDFSHLVKKSKKGKKAKKLDRILTVQKQIKTYSQQLKRCFEYSLVSTIRRLAQELHCLIAFYYSRQKKYLFRLRLNKFNTVARDLRMYFRRTVRAIFKCLPDFSGCEEEAKFAYTPVRKSISFTSQLNLHVSYKVFNKCLR